MFLSRMMHTPHSRKISIAVLSMLLAPALLSAGPTAGVGWSFHQNTSAKEFSTTLHSTKQSGLMPVSLETDRQSQRYLSLWQTNTDGRGWASFDGLTQDSFRDKLTEYRDKGYRLVDQSVELLGGSAVYSMVMMQNSEGAGWRSYTGLTEAEYQQLLAAQPQDYQLTDLEAVSHNGQTIYAVILQENKSALLWNQHINLSPADYDTLDQNYRKHGFQVVDVDCYAHNGSLHYAAIWQQSSVNKTYATRHQLSLPALHSAVRRLSDRGMRMVDIELCPATEDGDYQYVTVWQENAQRFAWPAAHQAQTLLQDYVSAEDVPGATAVIIHNGKVLFRAGAGYADTRSMQPAHSGTVYRLASIAKALVGTLAFDLLEEGLLDLDMPTRELLPNLSEAHDHTIAQVMTNIGCIKGYADDGYDDNNTHTQYPSAIDALQSHLGGALATDEWIISDCTIGQHNYSTHGYTILTAALEAVTGKSFADMIASRIAEPLGLDSLRVEDRTTTKAHGDRAALTYKGKLISEPNFQNASWKAGGSGMESSALDLALFADAVMRKYYFSEELLNAMWSGGDLDSQYHGWSKIVETAGSGTIEKGGVNQGTDVHLRIDTETGITVVAMTNTLLPAVRTPVLTDKLMQLAQQQLQKDNDNSGLLLSIIEE